METATDQEVMAAQEKLLKKREALGLTISPIRLMSSVPNEEDEPKCKHGLSRFSVCEDCQVEWKQEDLRREQEDMALKIAAKEADQKRRMEHPELWLINYGVPVKYFNASFETFQGGNAVKKACQSFPGKNIVLTGKTGCGKTHLAIARLREMVVNNEISQTHSYTPSWQSIYPAVYTTVPHLLMQIRDSFKDGSGETERGIVDRYCGYDIMILDDLGADRSTEWAIETLYLIIDGRDSNLKPTFITTNLTIPEIEQHYGARIASRIAGMSIINIDLPDYRKKR